MQARPVLLGLASAALFGAATPASKALLSSLSPFTLAGLLYLGAALATAAPALRPGNPSPWKAATRWRLGGAILAGGVMAPALLLLGLRVAQAASTSLWLNLELAATAILGVLLFRDHLGRLGWLAVASVLIGAITLTWQGGLAGARAALLVAGAAACWGLDNNLTALIDGIHPSQTTFWKGLVGGTTNLALGLATQPQALGLAPVAGALLVGALSYGASITLYIHCAQALGAARGQLLFATAPVWGIAGSALILHETLGWLHAAAALLMALGVLLMDRDRHTHEHQHEALAHTHSHRHDDGHHTHVHPGLPASTRHTHWHEHEAMTHRHPHWPDLHHRHQH